MRKLFCLSGLLTLLILITTAAAQDYGNAIIYDMPQEQIDRIFKIPPGSELTPEKLKSITDYRFTGDNVRILAIPLEWDSRPRTVTRETLDSLLFSRNVFPGGSVADYYYEVSYGRVEVTGDVLDWYEAENYTGENWFGFNDVLYDLNSVVDYSQYDGDDDGVVDVIVFIRAGTGQEDTRDPEDIWSFAITYGGNGLGPFDGVRVKKWNTSPELFPLRWPENPTLFSGEKVLNSIRVFCHEIGHSIGLPDLYDYDDKLLESSFYTPNDNNDHPLYDWCTMGYGGYGLFSIRSRNPAHLCGWSKKALGWIEPVVLMGEYEQVVMNPITVSGQNSLFMVPINPLEGEYFLLEYRSNHPDAKFDDTDSDFSCYFWPDLTFGADPKDEGLLITHVHDSLPSGSYRMNNGTPTYPHYTVIVEDAGYNPAMDYTNNPDSRVSDSAEWWYPYESRKSALFTPDVPGKIEFSPTTTPSSDGYYDPTGIVIRVDYMDEDQLIAYVYNPYIDSDLDGMQDPIDNCPNTFNPYQANWDDDEFGNACDNCPQVDNPDQTDSDLDGTGDECDICPEYDDNIDADADGAPDGCDICPGFNDFEDNDHDNIPDSCDNCPQVDNPDQTDTDLDGTGDDCDKCPGSDDEIDADADGAPDGCDICPGFNDFEDNDHDNIPDSCDNCPGVYNPDQDDSDGDNIGDVCDYICGDANGDRDTNVGDAVFVINFVFKGGPTPIPLEGGDANCDGNTDVGDAVYVINHVFKDGPAACCP
ncbi:MAG: M6 family metalloprotease domain-containing protein [candidate division Zixibacteria bacterium]